MSDPEPRYEALPNASNHFAWIRTQLGLQRTQMAAVRTAVSLIGFGFTVAQFFERMRSNLPEGLSRANADVPRALGLTLIAAGVLSLATFTYQYHRAKAYLRSGDFAQIAITDEKPMHTSVVLISAVVMLIGIAAFGSIFIHF
jgi:putative membrane protein